MPVTTKLRWSHGAGCHVPCVVAMASIRGDSPGHSPLQTDSFEMQLMHLFSLLLSLSLSLFEKVITQNMKMRLFSASDLHRLDFISKINKSIHTKIIETQQRFTKYYKHAHYFKSDPSCLHYGCFHLLFHYMSLIFDSEQHRKQHHMSVFVKQWSMHPQNEKGC